MSLTSHRTRRPALRDFQQQLAQRLQRARHALEGRSSEIAVTTCHGHWLFELGQTVEIIAGPAPAPVPLVRPWYLGIIHHRSEIIGVTDLDGFLGNPTAPWREGDRLLLLAPVQSLRCAIRVMRVQTLPAESSLRPLPPDPGLPPWTSAALADSDGVVWKRVNTDLLLRDPAFIDIGQA